MELQHKIAFWKQQLWLASKTKKNSHNAQVLSISRRLDQYILEWQKIYGMKGKENSSIDA